MTSDQISGVVRHILTTFGGVAVTGGYMTQDQLVSVAGGIAVLVGVIWSFWSKRNPS